MKLNIQVEKVFKVEQKAEREIGEFEAEVNAEHERNPEPNEPVEAEQIVDAVLRDRIA